MATNKKFRMMDVLLTVICVVFVAEAAAPVAKIGNSQFFYWIFLGLTFLLPYGLIAAELGTTYQGEGGLYDWSLKAFGRKWAARTAWYYWINYPIWMASLAVMTPILLGFMGLQLNPEMAILSELVFVAIVTLASTSPVAENVWIFNISAVIKISLAVILGILGVYTAMTKGFANPITVGSLLPSGFDGLGFISVVLFNFLGFEVVCTFADSMENPKRQIPQAIILGGMAIAAIYLFSSFGISAGIPVDQISTSSGLVAAVQTMTGKTSGFVIALVAGLFLISLFGNMISWAMGVNNVASYAADNGDMPRVFTKRNPKNNVPVGAAITNGVLASVIILVAPIIPNKDLFWAFFSLNLFSFLVSYIPMFPAFVRLRQVDPDTHRGYTVPGSPLQIRIMAALPVILIVISLVFLVVPMSLDAETLNSVLPITIGSIVIVAVNEIYLAVRKIPNTGSCADPVVEMPEQKRA